MKTPIKIAVSIDGVELSEDQAVSLFYGSYTLNTNENTVQNKFFVE